MKQTFVYVSCGESREIDAFLLDSVSGHLHLRQRLMTKGSPVPMRIVPEMRRLYVGTRNDNAVLAFSIDPGDGVLKTLGGVAAPGAPVYLSRDSAMHQLFLPSYADNQLSVFPLDEHGIPLAACQTISGLARAHAARPDLSGRWLLVPTLGADAIRVFRIGDAVGLVANDPPEMRVRSNSGPRHPVFSPDNRFVYCLNELDGHIDAFAFDAVRGTLDLRQSISMMPPVFSGVPWTAELRIRPDGRFLYATDRRSSTIAVLAVDSESGKLRVVDHTATEAQPRGMDLDPSGRWLVAAGQQSGHLAVYAVDPISGRLSPSCRHLTGADPICVEIGLF